VIDLSPASRNSNSYGITHQSTHVYRTSGGRFQSPHSPHRVVVWSNAHRLNPHPGEVRPTEFGSIGGEGKYLDPHNKGTDDPVTIILTAECSVISAHGNGTGMPASGQVFAAEPLAVGDVVHLRYPDGTVSAGYVVTARPLADPELLPVS
jgi:hypothetical protein